MSGLGDVLRIIAAYAVVFGAPPLGVAALDYRSRVGVWPRPDRTLRRADWQPLWDAIERDLGAYCDVWREHSRREALVHVLELVVSAGLLVRLCVHVPIAMYVYPERFGDGGDTDSESDIDDGLCWAPVRIEDWPVAAIARTIAFALGVWHLGSIATMQWGGPWWVTPLFRGYLGAQGLVLIAEPYAFLVTQQRRGVDWLGGLVPTETTTDGGDH